MIANVRLTAANCRSCHEQIYQQFVRSRHAAPSWAAIYGEKGLTPEQVNFSETYQPGGTRRPPHPFVVSEGGPAMASGCEQCHSVGKPNPDGTIGTCTACHTRHTSSVAIARLPTHLRAVPHGAGPFTDRDLRRIEARRDVCRAGKAC